MFLRRRKLPLAERVRDFVWPRSGWWRSTRYVVHRVRRLPGSPGSIASGFACGAFISFTPLFGLHYLLGATLAWILRGSVIASVFGAMLGWLYPLVMIWAYELGRHVIGAGGAHRLPLHVGWRYFTDHLWQAFVPTVIGSLPFGLVAAGLSFGIVYTIVDNYQRLRRRRHRLRPPAATAIEGSKR
jgi:uncharacterized protein (DUF2062 family)